MMIFLPMKGTLQARQGEEGEEVVRKGAVAALRYALMEKERATPIWTPGEDPIPTPSSTGDIH